MHAIIIFQQLSVFLAVAPCLFHATVCLEVLSLSGNPDLTARTSFARVVTQINSVLSGI